MFDKKNNYKKQKWNKNCSYYTIHQKSKRNFDYKLLENHIYYKKETLQEMLFLCHSL